MTRKTTALIAQERGVEKALRRARLQGNRKVRHIRRLVRIARTLQEN